MLTGSEATSVAFASVDLECHNTTLGNELELCRLYTGGHKANDDNALHRKGSYIVPLSARIDKRV